MLKIGEIGTKSGPNPRLSPAPVISCCRRKEKILHRLHKGQRAWVSAAENPFILLDFLMSTDYSASSDRIYEDSRPNTRQARRHQARQCRADEPEQPAIIVKVTRICADIACGRSPRRRLLLELRPSDPRHRGDRSLLDTQEDADTFEPCLLNGALRIRGRQAERGRHHGDGEVRMLEPTSPWVSARTFCAQDPTRRGAGGHEFRPLPTGRQECQRRADHHGNEPKYPRLKQGPDAAR